MAGISYFKGLAMNENYLYQHYYSSFGEGYWGIVRTNISTKIRENFKEMTEIGFERIGDLCGDGNYLSLLGENNVFVYDFSGNYIRTIPISSVYNKITSDGTNLYLSNSLAVDIYTVGGTFVRSIFETGIQAVAVKDGKMYIVSNSSGGAT